jgi:hypothetical protein
MKTYRVFFDSQVVDVKAKTVEELKETREGFGAALGLRFLNGEKLVAEFAVGHVQAFVEVGSIS